MDTAIIQKHALQLPEAQRALLAESLIESISHTPPGLREAWICESEKRIAAFRAGEIKAVDGQTALANLREAAE